MPLDSENRINDIRALRAWLAAHQISNDLGICTRPVLNFAFDLDRSMQQPVENVFSISEQKVQDYFSETPAAENRPLLRVLVLTAVESEFNAAKLFISNVHTERGTNGIRYCVGNYRGDQIDWQVWLVENGMGNIRAAITATTAIGDISPNLIVFAGIAGGLKPDDYPIGSVIFASKVSGYDYGKETDHLKPRSPSYPTQTALVNLARSLKTEWNGTGTFRVGVEHIVAGEKVVGSDDGPTAALLKELFSDAAAVAMEELGLFQASFENGQIPSIAIRGISDQLSGKTAKADSENQPIASSNAARFAFHFLSKLEPSDLGTTAAKPISKLDELKLEAEFPEGVTKELERLNDSPLIRERLKESFRNINYSGKEAKKFFTEVPNQLDHNPAIWAAVGEYFSNIPDCSEIAGRSFEQAACGNDRPDTNYLKAYIQYDDCDLADKASECLSCAADTYHNPNAIAIQAFLKRDFEEFFRISSGSDVDITGRCFRINAFILRGDNALALHEARESLFDYPDSANIVLNCARTAFHISLSDNTGMHDELLMLAKDLAIASRDVARFFGLDSSTSTSFAQYICIYIGETHRAISLGLPEPKGEACINESKNPRVQGYVAECLLRNGDKDGARQIIDAMSEGFLKTKIIGDYLYDADRQGAISQYKKIINDQDAKEEWIYAIDRLLELDGIDDAALQKLNSLPPEFAQLFTVRKLAHDGCFDDALIKARQSGKPYQVLTVAESFANSGNHFRAAELYSESGHATNDPSVFCAAATEYLRANTPEMALKMAKKALATCASNSPSCYRARLLIIQATSDLEQWDDVLAEAQDAEHSGLISDSIRWAKVLAFIKTSKTEEAKLEAFKQPRLHPDEPNKALIILQLESTENDGELGLVSVLDIFERYMDNSEIANHAMGASLFKSLKTDLTDNPILLARLRSLQERYFDTYGDSGAVRRYTFDTSDDSAFLESLRNMMQISPEVEQIQKDVLENLRIGNLPLFFAATARPSTYSEVLIKNAIGFVPALDSTEMVFSSEVETAKQAIGNTVFVNLSSFVVMMRSGFRPSWLLAFFSKIFVTEAAVLDAKQCKFILSTNSTSVLGWPNGEDRPIYQSIPKDLLDEWSATSSLLNNALSDSTIKVVSSTKEEIDDQLAAAMQEINNAADSGAYLLCDDIAYRILAREQGVPCFSSLALVEALSETGKISKRAYDSARINCMLSCVADFNWKLTDLLVVSELNGWHPYPSLSSVMSRPSFWTENNMTVLGKLMPYLAEHEVLLEWITVITSRLLIENSWDHEMVRGYLLLLQREAGSTDRMSQVFVDGARGGGYPEFLEDSCKYFLAISRKRFKENEVAHAYSNYFSNLNEIDKKNALSILLDCDNPIN